MHDHGITVLSEGIASLVFAAEDIFHVVHGEAGLMLAQGNQRGEFALEIEHLVLRAVEEDFDSPVVDLKPREIGAEFVEDAVAGPEDFYRATYL